MKALIYTWHYDVNDPYSMQLSGKQREVFQIYYWLGYDAKLSTEIVLDFIGVDNFCSTTDAVLFYLQIFLLQLRGNYFPNIKNSDRFCFK